MTKRKRNATMDAILEATTLVTKVPKNQIRGNGGAPAGSALARKMAAFVASEYFKLSRDEIESEFVYVGIRLGATMREVRTLIGDNPALANRVRSIRDHAGLILAKRSEDAAKEREKIADPHALTDTEIAEIAKLRAKGFSVKALARRLGKPEIIIAPVVGVTWGQTADL